jgi:hypothetical protein
VTTQLPDKPSELIRLALADLEKCEVDSRYKIHMSSWHEPDSRGSCCVCVAGAVMAQTFKISSEVWLTPSGMCSQLCLGGVIHSKLLALDELREGNIDGAFYILGINLPENAPTTFNVTQYDEFPLQFKADMRSMADMLESHGL